MATVELRNLVKRFGTVTAVDNVSLDIASGEIVCFLGPSGCGKTTTLRMIAGLEHPTAGEIAIDGQLVEGTGRSVPPEKRDLGMVFQSYALWPHMTVYKNVAMGLEVRRYAKGEVQERVHHVLDLLGLGALSERYPSQLSGGQQQRVALARSIAATPRVLLFDEPLSNLDAKIRERVRLDLHDVLKRVGITSIYVTHDQQEAMALADRIVLMKDGRIEQQGSARELYERPVSLFAADFIGWANFLPVTVTQAGGDGSLSVLETEDGQQFHTTASATGGKGTAAFRPEHICMGMPGVNGNAVNTWPVQIEKQVYLGSMVESHARLGQALVRLIGMDAPVGSVPKVHVPANRVMYFPDAP